MKIIREKEREKKKVRKQERTEGDQKGRGKNKKKERNQFDTFSNIFLFLSLRIFPRRNLGLLFENQQQRIHYASRGWRTSSLQKESVCHFLSIPKL